eukprot:11285793-Heterocapsa_arctica.AAC.1
MQTVLAGSQCMALKILLPVQLHDYGFPHRTTFSETTECMAVGPLSLVESHARVHWRGVQSIQSMPCKT